MEPANDKDRAKRAAAIREAARRGILDKATLQAEARRRGLVQPDTVTAEAPEPTAPRPDQLGPDGQPLAVSYPWPAPGTTDEKQSWPKTVGNAFMGSIVSTTADMVRGIPSAAARAPGLGTTLPVVVDQLALNKALPTDQVAGSMKGFAESTFPVDPSRQDNFGVQVAGGLGSTVPFLAANALPVIGPALGVAAGISMGTGSGLSEAEARGIQNMSDAQRLMYLSALGGAAESLPIERAILRAMKVVGGPQALKSVVAGIVEEGGQEALQQFLTNIGIQEFDQDHSLTEGIGESAAVGGTVGGVMNVLLSMAGLAKNRGRSNPTQPTNAPDPNQPQGVDGVSPDRQAAPDNATDVGSADSSVPMGGVESAQDLPIPAMTPDQVETFRTNLEALPDEELNNAPLDQLTDEQTALVRQEIARRENERAAATESAGSGEVGPGVRDDSNVQQPQAGGPEGVVDAAGQVGAVDPAGAVESAVDTKQPVYRGQPAGVSGQWYTPDQDAAQEYANQHEGGEVVSTTLPDGKYATRADAERVASELGIDTSDAPEYWLYSPETFDGAEAIVDALQKRGFVGAQVNDDFSPSGRAIRSYMVFQQSKGDADAATPQGNPQGQVQIDQGQTQEAEGQRSESFQAIDKPISQIRTDTKRFQPRVDEFAERTAERIATEFDPNLFEPIVLWKDPKTGEDFVLAGHSRLAGMKRRGETTIPARYFDGDEDAAIRFAAIENDKGTQLEDYERASYVRGLRDQGKSKAEIKREAESLYGKNAPTVLAYSNLNADGKALEAVRQFRSNTSGEGTDASTMAKWVGEVMGAVPGLSKSQENEIWDYLKAVYKQRDNARTQAGFVDFVRGHIERVSTFGQIPDRLNFDRQVTKDRQQMVIDQQIAEARKSVDDARKELEDKRREFIQRGAAGDKLDQALKPYNDAVTYAQREYIRIQEEAVGAKKEVQAQVGLFGAVDPAPIRDETITNDAEALRKAGVDDESIQKADGADEDTRQRVESVTAAVESTVENEESGNAGEDRGADTGADGQEVDFGADIPLDVAARAHAGTSFSPDVRAKQEQYDYAKTLQVMFDQAMSQAETPAQQAAVQEAFDTWRPKLKSAFLAKLSAQSRVVSSMIAGRSSFPARRMEKANATADKRRAEWVKATENARKALNRAVSGSATSEQVSEAEIARVKKDIDRVAATLLEIKSGEARGFDPSAFRNNLKGRLETRAKNGEAEVVKAALDYVREVQSKMDIVIFSDRNAVWKLAEKAEAKAEVQQESKTLREYEDGTEIYLNAKADRVQILFDSKPDEDTRNSLKSAGWRWSRTDGAWQRKATTAAARSASDILAKHGYTAAAKEDAAKQPDPAPVQKSKAQEGEFAVPELYYQMKERGIGQHPHMEPDARRAAEDDSADGRHRARFQEQKESIIIARGRSVGLPGKDKWRGAPLMAIQTMQRADGKWSWYHDSSVVSWSGPMRGAFDSEAEAFQAAVRRMTEDLGKYGQDTATGQQSGKKVLKWLSELSLDPTTIDPNAPDVLHYMDQRFEGDPGGNQRWVKYLKSPESFAELKVKHGATYARGESRLTRSSEPQISDEKARAVVAWIGSKQSVGVPDQAKKDLELMQMVTRPMDPKSEVDAKRRTLAQKYLADYNQAQEAAKKDAPQSRPAQESKSGMLEVGDRVSFEYNGITFYGSAAEVQYEGDRTLRIMPDNPEVFAGTEVQAMGRTQHIQIPHKDVRRTTKQKPTKEAPKPDSQIRPLKEMTIQEIEAILKGGDPNFYASSFEVDWGPRQRGQGKRSGGMVVGAMSAAPVGKKEYTDLLGLLPDAEKNDIADFEPDSYKQRYAMARSVGFPHDDALKLGYFPETYQSHTKQGSGLPPSGADLFGSPGIVSEPESFGRKRSPSKPQTKTAAFKRWFGKSKVVDKDGNPLVVYHGTNADIDAFTRQGIRRRDAGWFGGGFYFTADPALAKAYAETAGDDGVFDTPKGVNIMPVYLSVQNPYYIDISGLSINQQASYAARHGGSDAFSKMLREKGHDGIIVKHGSAPGDKGKFWEIVVFDPAQIKSATGNRGTFDPNNPSIVAETDSDQLDLFGSPIDEPQNMSEAQIKKMGKQLQADLNKLANNRTDIAGTLVAKAIADQVNEAGVYDILGLEVLTPAQLAQVAQIYRDPRWETMRYVFVKNGKIVAHEAVSQRVPGFTSLVPDGSEAGPEWLRDRVQKHGADTVYMLHNHPSTRLESSTQDKVATVHMSEGVPEFRAHIIIDSGKALVIEKGTQRKTVVGEVDPDARTEKPNKDSVDAGTWRGENLYERLVDVFTPKNDAYTPAMPNEALEMGVNGPDDAASVGKVVQRQGHQVGNGVVLLVARAASGKVRAVLQVSEEYLLRNGVPTKDGKKLIENLARTSGSSMIFAVGLNDDSAAMGYAILMETGHLVDAVNMAGKSYRDHYGMWDSPTHPFEKAGASFRVASREEDRLYLTPGGSSRDAYNRRMSLEDQALGRGGKEVSSVQLIESFAAILRAADSYVPIRHGRMGPAGRDAHGYFKVGPEVIRTKTANDITTSIHEVGHALEKAVYGWVKGTPFNESNGINQAMRDELLKMGKDLYGDKQPAGGYMREGWAEFLRYYVTTDEAGTVAPNLTAWFEGQFLAENEKVADAIQKAKDMSVRWQSQGAEARAFRSIESSDTVADKIQRKANKETAIQLKNRALTEIVTEAQPLKVLADEARKRGKKVPHREDPFLQIEALQKVQAGRVAYFINHGVTDIAGNIVGPALSDAVSILKARGKGYRQTRREFTLYLYARRALKLWTGGEYETDPDDKQYQRRKRDAGVWPAPLHKWREPRNPGISFEDAQFIFRKYDSPEFQKAASIVYDWNKGVMNYSKAAFGTDLSENVYDGDVGDYVPLKRVFDELSDMLGVQGGKGPGMVKGGDPVKKLKGSGRRIRDPFESMIESAEAMVRKTHARVILNSVVAYANYEGMGRYVEKVPRKSLPFKVRIKDLLDELEALGFDPEVLDGIAERDIGKRPDPAEADLEDVMDWDAKNAALREQIAFWTPAYAPVGTKDPILAVHTENGIEWYQLSEELYSALAALDPARLPWYLDLMFGVPARAFRAGTTGFRAAFSLITNPLRDLQTLYAQSQSSANPALMGYAFLKSLREGLMLQLGGNVRSYPYYDLFYRWGLEIAQPVGQDIDATKRAVRQLFEGKVVRFLDVRNWPDFFREILQIPETAIRTTEIRLLMDQYGWKPGTPVSEEMMYRISLSARRVSTDFGSQGKTAKLVNQMVPFTTAIIGGQRAFTRSFKTNTKRAALSAISFALSGLAYWWMFKDEEWYQDLTAQDRFTYYYFPFGDEVLVIPRQQEWGGVFFSTPEAIMDSWYRKDPEAVNDAMGHLFKNMNPLDLPVPLRVGAEQLANRSFYWDRPIVPQSVERRPAREQYGPYTAAIVRQLGEKLNVSPMRLEHMVYGFLGGVGGDMLQMSDPNLRRRKTGELTDIPVAGRLFRRGGTEGTSSKSKVVESFYSKRDEMIELQNSVMQAESEEQREARLLMADAQSALTILSFASMHTDDPAQQRRLTALKKKVARDALDSIEQGPEAVRDQRKRYARIAPPYRRGGRRSASSEKQTMREIPLEDAMKRIDQILDRLEAEDLQRNRR